MREASERQVAVLRAVQDAGGYLTQIEDEAAAEECIDRAWLLAEDHRGYALTLEGAAVARQYASASPRP